MPDSMLDSDSGPGNGSNFGYVGSNPSYTRGSGGPAPLQYSSAPSPYYGGPDGYSARRRHRGYGGNPGAYGASAASPSYGGNMLTLGQREAIRQLARQAAMQRMQQQYQRGW